LEFAGNLTAKYALSRRGKIRGWFAVACREKKRIARGKDFSFRRQIGRERETATSARERTRSIAGSIRVGQHGQGKPVAIPSPNAAVLPLPVRDAFPEEISRFPDIAR